jgi:flagellar hook-associated protein 2
VGTGINWQSIVSELTAASQQEETPYNNEISVYNTQISAWGTISSDLGSLQTAAGSLSSQGALDLYTANVTSNSTTSASTLLSATASSTANPGTYNVVVNSIAQAEQLGSSDFSSETSALNITGNILVNDQAVSISSSDSLQSLESKINALNAGSNPTGVTASIVQDSSSTYRLVLASDSTGASGISLLDGDTNNALEALGFNGSGPATVKNQVTGAAQSDPFSSTTTALNSLLGIPAQSGTVTINGKSVAISTADTLQQLESAMNSAGLSTSIVTSTSGSTPTYSLQIAGGINSFTDSNNMLQSLGFIQGNRSSEIGVTGSAANTSDGSTPITASTLLTGIYGYNTWTSGDSISITGTNHSGSTVSSNLAITQTSTVQDLLNQIDTTFGNVTASVTSNGQIQVVDNATGTSQLSMSLTPTIQDANSTLSFGSFGTVGTVRQYVLQQGTDASLSVDGMNVTSSSNTVSSAISGVTLNLLGASPSTTLSVNVGYDTSAIETQVNGMITAFNSVISDVNSQNAYNTATNTTGGPLFGDPVLEGLKAQLENSVLSQIGSGSYTSLASIGITVGSNGLLQMNQSTFESAVATDFQAVSNIFQDSGTTSNSMFQYMGNSSSTLSGTYNINLTSASSGTIDGQAATANGSLWTLSGSSSGANGVEVSYTGTSYPASATVTVSRGIGTLLSNLVNSYTNSVTGIITNQDSGINNTITGLQKQITDMQNNINQQEQSLTLEYENMNSTVASLDRMQSYLTAQLASL